MIPIHRGMKICSIVDDVCRRWTLVKEQVELKCHISEMSNSAMKLLNGEDIDRIIDMHEILGQKIINIDVQVFGLEEIISFRASEEQSSVNNNIGSNISTSSCQEMRLRHLFYGFMEWLTEQSCFQLGKLAHHSLNRLAWHVNLRLIQTLLIA
ncbi:hypothetical protein Taro_036895 [Colocasia esculenta]|uniref:Uncharacterized protein n=1 Tax=Colocasia esculenta TaxID=4460 RepID=A0A843W2R0_COLES|nr:hypothetical protein [Colocasia esculenta]